MSSDRIGLVEAIHALREELREAQDKAPADMKFTVEDIEVSFEVVTEKTVEAGVGASGKIKFWLVDVDVNADGKGSYSKSKSQTVTLRLTPSDHRIPGTPREVNVADKVTIPSD